MALTPHDKESTAPNGSTAQKLPALPSPTESNLVEVVSKIKEHLEVREGRRGSSYEKVVTWRDLSDAGIINMAPGRPDALGWDMPVGTSTYRTLMTQLEKDLRGTQLYKDLSARIGSVEDMESYPQELRNLLQASLLEEAQKRKASITEVADKVQELDRSVAHKMIEVTSSLAGNAAALRHLDFAYASTSRAISASMTQVTARLNNMGGTGVAVESKILAQADDITGLRGQYTVKVDVDGKVAGFGLASETNTAGVNTSAFIVKADKFGVFTGTGDVMPFGVDGNGVYINGSLRVNAGGGSLTSALSNIVHYVGSFASHPATASYSVGDIYKNTTDGNSYVLREPAGVKTWELFLEKGAAGDTGPTGPAGTQGIRGTVNVARAIAGTTWDNIEASNAISAAGYGSPQVRDIVTLHNKAQNYTETRYHGGSNIWYTLDAYINGNLLVGGNISGVTIGIGSGVSYMGQIYTTNNGYSFEVPTNGLVGASWLSNTRFLGGTASIGNVMYGTDPTLSLSTAISNATVALKIHSGNVEATSSTATYNTVNTTNLSVTNTISGTISGSNVSGAVANATNANYATSAGSANSATSATTATDAGRVYNSGNAGLHASNGTHYAVMQTDGNFVVYKSGAAFWASDATGGNVSDKRLKKNIVPAARPGLATIQKLNVVDFDWDGELDFGTRKQTGFLAQEIQQVIPEAVFDINGTLSFDKSHLIPYLVKAVQELNAEVAKLKAAKGV